MSFVAGKSEEQIKESFDHQGFRTRCANLWPLGQLMAVVGIDAAVRQTL
jgi:hypothetical protein